MLKLKPSARDRKRYILLKGRKQDIETAILDYIGVLGYAKASPRFIKTRKTGQQVLLVNRGELEKVRASFALYSKKIEIVKVASTIKGLGGK